MQDAELVRLARVAATRAMFFVDALDGMSSVLAALDQPDAVEAIESLSVWWAIHGLHAMTFLDGIGNGAPLVSAFDALAPDAALLRAPAAGHA